MRGLDIPSLNCPLCDADFDSIEHALFCPLNVWKATAKWCGVHSLFMRNVLDLSSQDVINLVPTAARNVWEAIRIISAWCIWRARNTVIKEGKNKSLLEVISDI